MLHNKYDRVYIHPCHSVVTQNYTKCFYKASIQGSCITGLPLVISAEITPPVNHKQFKSFIWS